MISHSSPKFLPRHAQFPHHTWVCGHELRGGVGCGRTPRSAQARSCKGVGLVRRVNVCSPGSMRTRWRQRVPSSASRSERVFAVKPSAVFWEPALGRALSEETMLVFLGGGDLTTPQGFYQVETFGGMAPILVMIVAIAIGTGH